MISGKTALRWLSHCFSMERAALVHLVFRTAWISTPFKLFELWPNLLLTSQSAADEISAVCGQRRPGSNTYMQRRERKTDEKSVALWPILILSFCSDVVMFHAHKLVMVDFFHCCSIRMASAKAFFRDKLEYIVNKLFILLFYFRGWQLVWLLPSNSN